MSKKLSGIYKITCIFNKKIAVKYNVCVATIGCIKRGITWKDVK